MKTSISKQDAAVDAAHKLIETLLDGLSTLGFFRKIFRSSLLSQLGQMSVEKKAQLDECLEMVTKQKPSKRSSRSINVLAVKSTLETVAALLGEALQAIANAGTEIDPAQGITMALHGFKCAAQSTEILYSLVADVPEVNRFFISPGFKDNADVLRRVQETSYGKENTGLISMQGNERGGYSVYVPEYYSDDRAWPLVVALHQPNGHGSDFIWHWLKDARTLGAILVAPTSIGDTWSLAGRDVDSGNINHILNEVKERWNLNPSKWLLTGTSDGGTFCYLLGLRLSSPFSHLAPCAANFHTSLVELAPSSRLNSLPIYLVHGCEDWVFPLSLSRSAKAALSVSGAKVVYHEIPNLGHAHPDEENIRIMDWFLQG